MRRLLKLSMALLVVAIGLDLLSKVEAHVAVASAVQEVRPDEPGEPGLSEATRRYAALSDRICWAGVVSAGLGMLVWLLSLFAGRSRVSLTPLVLAMVYAILYLFVI